MIRKIVNAFCCRERVVIPDRIAFSEIAVLGALL